MFIKHSHMLLFAPCGLPSLRAVEEAKLTPIFKDFCILKLLECSSQLFSRSYQILRGPIVEEIHLP